MIGADGVSQVLLKDIKLWSHTSKLQKKEKQNTFAKTADGKYFVKIGIDNRVYNPIGMYSEGQHNKMLQKIGKKQFNFKRVNKKVYDLYVSFLRTKNLAWLNNADRDLL